jgi:predicted secreted hydrolase
MFYLIRLEDGGVEPVSAGVLVEPDGSVRRLHLDDVEIEPLGSWTSPHSKASYPAEWNLRIPAANIDLHLKPLLQDQELNLTFTYWEGAVRVTGSQTGYGYVELTGYAGSMRGRT